MRNLLLKLDIFVDLNDLNATHRDCGLGSFAGTVPQEALMTSETTSRLIVRYEAPEIPEPCIALASWDLSTDFSADFVSALLLPGLLFGLTFWRRNSDIAR